MQADVPCFSSGLPISHACCYITAVGSLQTPVPCCPLDYLALDVELHSDYHAPRFRTRQMRCLHVSFSAQMMTGWGSHFAQWVTFHYQSVYAGVLTRRDTQPFGRRCTALSRSMNAHMCVVKYQETPTSLEISRAKASNIVAS